MLCGAGEALGEVVGLVEAVGEPHAEPHGGGREAVLHPPHRGREGPQGGGVKLLLQQPVVLLLQAPPLLRSPVLEPNFHLRRRRGSGWLGQGREGKMETK